MLVVATAAGRWGPLIRFACATGLRPEEWIGLEWRDLDLSNRTVTLRGTVVDGVWRDGDAKTPGSLRTVALAAPAIRAIQELPRPLRNNQLIFPASGGGNRRKRGHGGYINLDNWRRRVWDPIFGDPEVVRAGLKRRPLYQMRHTYATLALAQGVTLEWISEQMGHEDLRITKKFYARFVKQVDDRERTKLDRLEDEDTSCASNVWSAD